MRPAEGEHGANAAMASSLAGGSAGAAGLAKSLASSDRSQKVGTGRGALSHRLAGRAELAVCGGEERDERKKKEINVPVRAKLYNELHGG